MDDFTEEILKDSGLSETERDLADVPERVEKDYVKPVQARKIRTLAAAAALVLIVCAAIVIAISFAGQGENTAVDTAGSESVMDSGSGVSDGAETHAMAQHHIERTGMTFTLPAYIYTTGQHVDEDFAPLADFGIDAQSLEDYYKDNNVYFNAVWRSDAQYEITVTMTTDGYTYALYDLNRATLEELEKIKSSFTSYGTLTDHEPGVVFGEVEVYDGHEQALFIKACCNVATSAAYENRVMYMTVLNGQRITVTLIERYPSGEGVDTSLYSSSVTEEGAEILSGMLGSLRFDKVKSAFWARYRFLIGFGSIAIVGAGVLYVLLKVRQKRVESSPLAEEKSEDNEESE